MISSRKHPFVQRCRQIARGRGEPGEVLLDGLHLVRDAMRAGVPILGAMTTAEMHDELAAIAPAAETHFIGSPDVIDAASPVRTPTGIVAIAAWQPAPAEALLSAHPRVVIGLAGVQDPGNVGNVIRSADAFGADGVLLLDGSADPGNWKTLRAAMGSTFRIAVALGSTADAMTLARTHGLRIASTVTTGGSPPWEVDLAAPLLIVIGSEGSGLPADVVGAADLHLTLPMRSGIDSLNAATTAAILLWESGRSRRAPGRGTR